MLTHPTIDPVALALGPLKIRWYGLMYLLGFAAGWALGRYRAGRAGFERWSAQQIDDLVFYIALGIIVGGRLGSVLFYNSDRLASDPLMILRIWEGGMSFHGGLIGVLIAMILFARKYDHTFFAVTDFIAPLIPPGLLFGRIGNFINGELWGRPTELPWGMVFQTAPDALPRHPSQLYEAALEGLLLFIILWLYSTKPRPTMAVSGLFLVGYGTFRSLVELVREPDAHLGFIAGDWLTMGQMLSLPMIFIGLLLMTVAYRRRTEPV